MGRLRVACFAVAYACGSPAPISGATVYVWEDVQTSGSSYEAGAFVPGPALFTCDGASDVMGACCFFADPKRPKPQLSAGKIHFTNATTGAVLHDVPYNGGNYQNISWGNGESLFSPGDLVSASAPGDGVTGFQVSQAAPTHFVGLAPAWTIPIPITRTADFVVTWTPDGGAQVVHVSIGGLDDVASVSHGFAFCEVPESAGTVTVPSAYLQRFSPGDVCNPCSVYRVNRMVSGGVTLEVATGLSAGAKF